MELDLISVTSILPLLYLLTSQPESIFDHYFISTIANILYIKDSNQLLLYSTFLFAVVAITLGSLKLSNLFYSSDFLGLLQVTLVKEYFQMYISTIFIS